MAPWFTAAELAGLPGLPGSEFRTRAKLDKLGVPSRLRAGTKGGGGREYDAAHLPAETRAALLLQHLTPALPAPVQPAPAAPVVAVVAPQPQGAVVPAPHLQQPPSRASTACADARLLLVRTVEQAAPLCGGMKRAAAQLADQVRLGIASPEVLAAARAANQRARQVDGTGVALAARSLERWREAHATGGWQALLPEPTKPAPLTVLGPDVTNVLQRYATTRGGARMLTDVARAVGRELGMGYREQMALYSRARRALAKVDKVQLIKARHTGAEREAKLPYQRRLKADLRPLEVAVCDGHSFKAKVRHPDHGAPFTPEVTLVMDVATRRVTGWSVSLSESTIAVGDAYRHSVQQHGVHALVYTDNGSGQSAKALDCPVAGVMARLGTEHKTGRPGSPQGRGVIERSWQTHMIRCASQFATFTRGDEGSYRKTHLELAREQRAVKRAQASGEVIALSAKCPSWAQFLDAVARAIVEYNAEHRHRGLPRHTSGPLQGLHMTPDEAWAALLQPDDVVRVDPVMLRSVFMPSTVRTAQRGWVRTLSGQHYYAEALMQVDGERVRVDHDIHDGSRVWVWTLDGTFIAEARFEGNSANFLPRSVIDLARERRVQAAVKRRQQQIDLAQRELLPGADAAPATPAMACITDELQLVERVDEAPTPAAAEGDHARPFFDSASERYEWLMRNRSRATADEQTWLAAYAATPDYEALRDYYDSRGVAYPEASDDSSFNQAG